MQPVSPVCVLGMGLIGGSVMRALGPDSTYGWNRSAANVEAARADGFDASADLEATLRRAAADDALLVIGVPMPAVGAVADAVAAHAPDVALTDVVSVKAPVLRELRARGLGARYVGGHPMAGTAESGWAATSSGLFDDATWLVAADDGADPEVWTRVAGLAVRCGSRVVTATSDDHDAAVARVSHLPHVLAEVLAASGAAGGDLSLALGAGSFRDGTRVAATAPALVRAICEPNHEALLAVLDECLGELHAARDSLAAHGKLGDLVDSGFAGRSAFDSRAHDSEPVVVSPGAPGWLETARAAGAAGRAVVPLRRGG